MSPSVLLVDDDEFARGFVRLVLERAGFDVHEAEDVATALSAARASRIQAVVTDWNLPDGNGGMLARTLHANASTLPIILITGEGPGCEPMVAEASDQFSAILHKPFSPSLLAAALQIAVNQ